MLVEVWRLAIERYAPKRNDTVGLRELDRLSITGEKNIADADRSLSVLLRGLKYRVRKYPNRWDVRIRNLSLKHGIESEEPTAVNVADREHKKEERRKKKEERRKGTTNASRPTNPPKKPATTCPEKLPDSHGANAADWAAARGTGIAELEFRWQRVRRWSDQNPTKRRTALGWYRTLQNAVEDQWGGNPSKPADESPAQGRQRRTREAAAGALEILKRNRDQGPLELHAGGKS
jgi:hypothetical protein